VSHEAARRPGIEHHEIDVGDGLRLHVASSGSGAPLLLLHGFTGSTETWTSLRAALGDRFAIHAVDLPGHGRSAAPQDPARYGLRRLADDLAAVIDALDIERAAVLGYSLGGRAALRFALDHPSRLHSLVLESVSPGVIDAAERESRRVADEGLAEAIERDGIPAFVERWERLPLWSSQSALPDARRAALRAQRLANSARGLANSLRGSGAAVEAPAIDRLAAMRVPTLLIVGALDAKYIGLGRFMEASMPAARLTVIDGAGHAVHLEEPAAYASAVAEFLEAVR
jgi:2-succinyl-6-hydroxy-2,4-cyclohexadiene-1-carboxylate synthase